MTSRSAGSAHSLCCIHVAWRCRKTEEMQGKWRKIVAINATPELSARLDAGFLKPLFLYNLAWMPDEDSNLD